MISHLHSFARLPTHPNPPHSFHSREHRQCRRVLRPLLRRLRHTRRPPSGLSLRSYPLFLAGNQFSSICIGGRGSALWAKIEDLRSSLPPSHTEVLVSASPKLIKILTINQNILKSEILTIIQILHLSVRDRNQGPSYSGRPPQPAHCGPKREIFGPLTPDTRKSSFSPPPQRGDFLLLLFWPQLYSPGLDLAWPNKEG